MRTSIALHGNAVSFAETPGNFEQVGGIAWTDVVGLRSGPGAKFRGRGGTLGWFHYDLAAMAMVRDVAYGLSRLRVLVDVQNGARVDHVHVWDCNRRRLFAADDLARTADFDVEVTGAAAAAGLGVSLGVRFQQAADVLFRGLVADFVAVARPPVCARVTSTFTGFATLHTNNGNAEGPFSQQLRMTVEFDADCRTARLGTLDPIAVTFGTPLGQNTSTFTVGGGGLGELDRTRPPPRAFTMPLRLQLDNTLESGSPDSVLDVTLTTGSVTSFRGPLAGRGMDGAGAIRLVGVGRFRGGFLGNSEATLEVEGSFTPVP